MVVLSGGAAAVKSQKRALAPREEWDIHIHNIYFSVANLQSNTATPCCFSLLKGVGRMLVMLVTVKKCLLDGLRSKF